MKDNVRNNITLLTIILLIAGLLFLLPQRDSSGVNGTEGGIAINPQSDVSTERHTHALYYRFEHGYPGEALLCAVYEDLQPSADESLESLLIKRLINGPAARPDIVSCINRDTKLISLTTNKDYIFVTLSREFLEPETAALKGSAAREEEQSRTMRLAVYSIVNSLTELGEYSRVQILIDLDGSGNGRRVQRGQLGLVDGKNDAQLIEPLGHDAAMTLSPPKAVESCVQLLMSESYEDAYRLVAVRDMKGIARPPVSEAVSMIAGSNMRITSVTVLEQTISGDGSTALVTLDLRVRYMDSEGTETVKPRIPIKLIRENEVWKVTYAALSIIYQ